MFKKFHRSVLVAALLTILGLPAFATPTNINAVAPKSPNAGAPGVGSAQLDGTACDAVNGNKTAVVDGKLYLQFVNTHATNAYTVDITSVADDLGRSGTITAYSIPALKIATFGPFTAKGWAQGAGVNQGCVLYTAENAAVKAQPLVVR